ncbi:MAG: hypothetical protein AAGC43_03800 [Bacteroidota bacterium]
MKPATKTKIWITLAITLLVWGHILWDYFHGGIPTHYLLHNKDLPGIPNWVGGIVLPFFSWVLLGRIQKRLQAKDSKENLSLVVYRFFCALMIAIVIAVSFLEGIPITDYIMLGIFILAFIFPLYKSEYLLGWVLGSAFTFGAIIPIGFGSLFALVCFLFYVIGTFIKKLLGSKA